MLDKIIIGYDGGAEAADALALGRSLASLTGGRLILAAVLPVKEEPIGLNGYEQALREDSDRLFAEVLQGSMDSTSTPGPSATGCLRTPSGTWRWPRRPMPSSSAPHTAGHSDASTPVASPSAFSTMHPARCR